MKKNKAFRAAIFVIVIIFVWIASLYACIQLKQDSSFNLAEIAQTEGTYIYDDTILGVPVARTVVEVEASGALNIHGENYATLHIFPLLFTGVFVVIVGLASMVIRRIGRRLEI